MRRGPAWCAQFSGERGSRQVTQSLTGRSGERSEEHTSELQSRQYLVCRLLLEKKKDTTSRRYSIKIASSRIVTACPHTHLFLCHSSQSNASHDSSGIKIAPHSVTTMRPIPSWG